MSARAYQINQTCYSENGGHFTFLSFWGVAVVMVIPPTHFNKFIRIVDGMSENFSFFAAQ